jgi:hypothetical protein
MEGKLMERGIYFDGWYKNNHCYHPSLPIRNMQMIEDLEKYKGTLLVWSALGGGSISLPYLEHEAYGKVDPRLRFYGFMNDSEFMAQCNKRGIKVFGIVFEVQGWEFPAVVSEDGKEFKELNVIKGEINHNWYGLREFTSNKYYEIFGKKFEDYFPGGLYNSDGEEVTDIWEECCARDYNGIPCHSEWVEVKNHEQIAYQMCRNNPVWRAYLKQIIKIQIDAGVAGVQLDECELPMTSIRYGGCFCKDCMKQFKDYLKELESKGELIQELEGINLDNFNYGEYLKRLNISYPGDVKNVPLYKYYWEFQLRAIKKYFNELVIYAKEYGLAKGREVLVSGNFFNIMPSYYPLEKDVDVIITEMKQTLFKQPYWYRYVAGFAGDKPVIVAENPYGGIVVELLEMLNEGKAYDLYKIFLIEAAAYGCNMAVPYGGWMGNTVKDAFYPPRSVTEKVQSFLAVNEGLYSKKSGAKVLVLYSFPSYYWREAVSGYSSSVLDSEEGILSYSVADMDDPNSTRLPFWEVIKSLSDKQVIYDVKFSADGILREDELGSEDLAGYNLVILPDCTTLTFNQTHIFENYAKAGGKLLIFGEAAKNIAGWCERVKALDGVIYCSNDDYKPKALQDFAKAFDRLYEDIWQIETDNPSVGLQMHKLEKGASIHIINYNYSKEKDKVSVIDKLNLRLHLDQADYNIKIYNLDNKEIRYSATFHSGIINIDLYEVPLYTIVELTT